MTPDTISTIFYMNGEKISPMALILGFVVVIGCIVLLAKVCDVNKAK